jgi:hypothetical protein
MGVKATCNYSTASDCQVRMHNYTHDKNKLYWHNSELHLSTAAL